MGNEAINEYTKLVWIAIPNKPGTEKQELCQRFLRKCPTPLAIKRLSRTEKNEISEQTPEMLNFFATIELRKTVTKSHEEVIGHAYSSIELGREMVDHFQSEGQENVYITCTDIHNEVIDWKILFVGGECECILYPDKIFQYALRCPAQGIIMIHNHPTGDIHLSKQDESFTRRLERGCEIIGLHLADFMIVGRDTYHSWREASLVNELKK